MKVLSVKDKKAEFLSRNETLTEIDFEETGTVGDFQNIDDFEDEIWILQCPKGFLVEDLKGKKLKMPGRTKTENIEAIAIESEVASNKKEAFGYCTTQKGRNAIKLISIAGKIVLHNKLESVSTIDEFDTGSKQGRVALPSSIKVRHPLLGYKYHEHIRTAEEVKERLKAAEELSLQASTAVDSNLKSASSNKKTHVAKQKKHKIKEEIHVIESSEEEKHVKNAKKRKIKSEEGADETSSLSKKKSKKKKLLSEGNTSEDV